MLKGRCQWQEIAGPYVHRKERVGNAQGREKKILWHLGYCRGVWEMKGMLELWEEKYGI